jgi:ABC-type transport system involved in cytochrome c biogenesis permease subunit
MPTTGQVILLGLAIALFAAGGLVSLLRLRWDRNSLRIAAKACLWSGVTVGIAVLVWHYRTRGSWLPLEDNFDALVWLGLMLALFVLYVQRVHPLGGLDWFVMPIVVLLLGAAALFGVAKPHEYDVRGPWSWVHWVTAYGGFVAFAVAGAVGLMYLIVNRRLRAKIATTGPNFGSLERLEHLTRTSVTLGFAMLTIGMVTGMAIILSHPGGRTTMGADWWRSPKVLLAAAVWVVYALVLHAPINPSFRGRKTALLSIVGFVLMVGTLVAVQYMPAR